MHISFIPYGERSCVERMFRDMEAQKHLMPMTKGKKKQGVWMPGQIRYLPFGVYEYVFCKESLDMVLRTFKAAEQEITSKYGINFKTPIYKFLRKLLKLKPVPKYEEEGNLYLWNKAYVNIIVLGIREDADIVGYEIDDLGWEHEAL